jgi:hypothetical protein
LLVVTLLLSVAALVVLTAVGAGTLLYMAAGSIALSASKPPPAQAAPERPSFEPDARDAPGGAALPLSGDGPSRPPGPVDEEVNLLLLPPEDAQALTVAIEALHSLPAEREAFAAARLAPSDESGGAHG